MENQTLNFRSAPVSLYEFNLIRMQTIAFSIKDGNAYKSPSFCSPKFLISKLIQYYKSYVGIGVDGIRIYPGYDEPNKTLVLICCLSGLQDSEEFNYVLLNRNDYGSNDPFETSISIPEAKKLHDDYLNFVYIFKQPQLKNLIRYSRFYEWAEINNFISGNILNGPPVKSEIQFDYGYISNEMVAIVLDRIIDPIRRTIYQPNEMQGFTALAQLFGENGKSCFVEDAEYDPSTKNYKGLALEVGHPCPPRCGVLHQ